MISNLIVFSSLILAGVFTLLYLFKPGLRERIEEPKYTFLRQLSMYDRHRGAGKESSRDDPHDLDDAQAESKRQVTHSGGDSE